MTYYFFQNSKTKINAKIEVQNKKIVASKINRKLETKATNLRGIYIFAKIYHRLLMILPILINLPILESFRTN